MDTDFFESTNVANTKMIEKKLVVRLPYDLEIEKTLLGALIYDNNNINITLDILKSQFFYEKLHASIYMIITKLIEKGKTANVHAIENHLLYAKEFAEIFTDTNASDLAKILKERGGAEYLQGLANNYILGVTNVKAIAEDIRDYYLRRQIIQISHGILTESYANYSLELTPFKFIEKAEEQLFKIATETTSSSSQIFKSFTHSLRDVIKQVQKAKEKGGLSGIETGFTEINRYIHGWQPSDLIIVAGRPSMGKTSFAIGVAINAAHAIVKEREQLEKQIFEAKIAQNISEEDARSEAIKESITKAGSIGVFSLEMSADQLTTRILAVETGLDTNWLVGGTVDDIQMRQIVDTAKNLEDLPIFIDETPAVTIAQIRTRARRLKRRFGLKLLVIDYLQLIKGGNSENRVQEISAITQGLKAIAKELNIPIIALSQLSRNVESRDDKRPQLSDLRESGSIEQDADIVMFLYRDSYYLERTRPEGDEDLMRQWEEKNGAKLKKVKNKAEIIIAKHRNGPIGTAVLKFDEDTTKFENFTATEEKYYIN